ncbi:hypothetical protein [Salinicoccus halodurans]|uniref:Uncharacterized protein n=1 Tax=Salinicoccus halodurans TaxID=407035 RepID=A0A0F7HL87_9STAP|nr:hypothetical protein [Salinicoccus halodurans]AKG74683.1 hypothetical protein AAT16_11060 [Salinicoccus halodurans]SFK88515.1 hypothetical protein SAMN05216235_2237 [Salinicoccus halodurans]
MLWILGIVLIATIGGFGSEYLKHQRKMEKMRIDAIDKQLELERLKQENFLLENQHMKSELERIKEENKKLLEAKQKDKDSPWLIEETKAESEE